MRSGRCSVVSGLIVILLGMMAPVEVVIGGGEGETSNPGMRSEAGQREILERINESPFPESIVLQSEEASDAIHGDLHGIVDAPFESLAAYLETTTHWCAILFLHLNVKSCVQEGDGGEGMLDVYMGRRHYEKPEDADHVRFRFEVVEQDAGLIAVDMRSEEEARGTQEIRIQVQAAALDEERSLVHMRYSVGIGRVGRTLLRVYLGTAGRDRVGFTVVRTDRAGDPVYVRAIRGMVERNTVRFYLALQAFVEYPEAEQLEQRFERWFELTDQHPEQLREVDRESYLDNKRREYENQRALQEALRSGE